MDTALSWCMDNDQRAALAALNETMAAGFDRMDRYFDVHHRWMRGWLDELRSEQELRRRTTELSHRVVRLEQEVQPPREHVWKEIADMRLELFELRWDAWPIDYLRREIASLTTRVDRIEGYSPTDPALKALRRQDAR
jgi:hypothetical protein